MQCPHVPSKEKNYSKKTSQFIEQKVSNYSMSPCPHPTKNIRKKNYEKKALSRLNKKYSLIECPHVPIGTKIDIHKRIKNFTCTNKKQNRIKNHLLSLTNQSINVPMSPYCKKNITKKIILINEASPVLNKKYSLIECPHVPITIKINTHTRLEKIFLSLTKNITKIKIAYYNKSIVQCPHVPIFQKNDRKKLFNNNNISQLFSNKNY